MNQLQQEELKTAFLSWGGITDLISKIVDSMYTASEYDELQVMKYMLARQILDGLMKPQEIPQITTDTMKEVVAQFRETSNNLEFLSPVYNLAGVMNNSKKSEQYIIVSTKFDAKMSVEVLATAFNMDKTEMLGHSVLIDGFGKLDNARLAMLFAEDKTYKEVTPQELQALEDIPAVVVDVDWFQIYDNLIQYTEINNPQGLYWNYFLHTWKTFSVSPFACNTLFVPVTPAVTSVEVAPATVTTSINTDLQFNASVVTTGFASKTVNWSINSELSTIDNKGRVHIGEDETEPSLTVTATSVFDPTKTGTATITIA